VAHSIALDSTGNVYLVGVSTATDFPVTAGAFQTTNNAITHFTGFVTKFSPGAVLIGTTTALTSSANPQTLESAVTFTATVTPASGNGVPTGSITSTVDGDAGPALSLVEGVASFTTSSLPAGQHTIVVTYEPDSDSSDYSSSSATLVETISGPAVTSIGIASGSGQSAVYGAAFATPLTVVVKNASGTAISGTVVSFAGAGLKFSSSTATTGSNGEVSVTATAMGVGGLTAVASASGVTATAGFALTEPKRL
jgi:Bacterial Ig-like domain (group 3)/Beta-propeller repeat